MRLRECLVSGIRAYNMCFDFTLSSCGRVLLIEIHIGEHKPISNLNPACSGYRLQHGGLILCVFVVRSSAVRLDQRQRAQANSGLSPACSDYRYIETRRRHFPT